MGEVKERIVDDIGEMGMNGCMDGGVMEVVFSNTTAVHLSPSFSPHTNRSTVSSVTTVVLVKNAPHRDGKMWQ